MGREGGMKLPRERFQYAAMVDHAPIRLPRGARIAVWTIVNREEWDIQGPMPRTALPAPGGDSVIPETREQMRRERVEQNIQKPEDRLTRLYNVLAHKERHLGELESKRDSGRSDSFRERVE